MRTALAVACSSMPLFESWLLEAVTPLVSAGGSVLRWEKSHTPATTVSWRSSFRYAASIRKIA